jgi:transcriptional regulator with XRE-family HTH domain
MQSTPLSFTPAEIGTHLARLRRQSGKTQADVAVALGVDSSKISRIEDGKVAPSEQDIDIIVRCLGTKEATQYQRYLQLNWKFLKRPAFDHPDLEHLEMAESALQRIEAFCAENASPALIAQSSMHMDGLIRAAGYLLGLDHSLGFIGPIGVGKTTGLCTLCNLVRGDEGKNPVEQILLEYGAGGTTICEVAIRTGPEFKLVVDLYTEEEVIQFVNDFCAGLLDPHPDTEEGERGVPKEIDRAIRNMSGLKKLRSKGADGKRVTTDPAVDLARELRPEALRAEVFSRLKLWERTAIQLVHEPSVHEDGRLWLRKVFAEINKGQRSEVGLPRRITVIVPFPLMPGVPFDITIVDTKGIDGSPLRPDLKACLENPRMITVLCSAFNEAPGPIFEQLLKQTIDTGSSESAFGRCVGLALARDGEAKKMKDEGEFVQTAEEGYELKIDQAESELRRWGCGSIPVQVYNANSDSAAQVLAFLAKKVRQLRSDQSTRIAQISEEIDRLIRDHQSALLAQAQHEVFRRLSIFVRQHRSLPARVDGVQSRLDRAIREQHQRSVWATTTRLGTWPALDVYYYLGIGAAIDAKKRADPALDGLQELITNMIGDETLAPAHGFLRELQNNARTWRDDFIEAVTRIGESTFRPALKDATDLWRRCSDRYGRGSGYRDVVGDYVAQWFEAEAQLELHALLEQHVVRAWEQRFLNRVNGLCNPHAEVGDAAA